MNKKIFLSSVAILLAIILIFITKNNSLAMTHYENTGFVTGIVTGNTVNVRQGPGVNFGVITQVNKNEYIRVFAKVGNWYIIQTDKDYIGAISKDYVRAIYPSGNNSGSGNAGNNNPTTPNPPTENQKNNEEEVLKLINEQRSKNGLTPLVMDAELQRVARIKAEDMVNNNYFSHTSPTYGSPFEMIKNFGINYRTAGENIAGNSTNKGAVDAWMASEGHRENILNNAYNYTGIGVVKSSKYGYVYVQMFIGK